MRQTNPRKTTVLKKGFSEFYRFGLDAPTTGYAFDSGYYAQPGIWGKMFYESTPLVFEATRNRDKAIGASFIEQKALEGFKVKQDVIYAQPGVKKLKYDIAVQDGLNSCCNPNLVWYIPRPVLSRERQKGEFFTLNADN